MTDSLSVSAAPLGAARRPTRFPILTMLLLALFAALAPLAIPARAEAQESSPPMTVARVVAGRVDIAIPGQRRPAVGDRLVVVRDGVALAELEVTLLDVHRASCRIVHMSAPIAGGDLVRPVAAGLGAPPPQADTAGEHPSNQAMIVQRVLRGAVDISLVSSQPVAVGDRLVVERGSLVIGELEVVLVGDHSASCRIDREVRPITQGDRVRRLDVPPPAPAPPAPPTPATPDPTPGTAVPNRWRRNRRLRNLRRPFPASPRNRRRSGSGRCSPRRSFSTPAVRRAWPSASASRSCAPTPRPAPLPRSPSSRSPSSPAARPRARSSRRRQRLPSAIW